MLPYWLLFSVFAAGSVQYRRRGLIGSQSAPLFWAAGLLVALMVGLRYQVGGDWGNYVTIYRTFKYSQLTGALGAGDPGYAVLNWLGSSLGLGIWFVNLLCGAIFTWGLLRFARRQPNPWLAVLVAIPYLIIVVAMGYTRQAVAMGIILAGLSSLTGRWVLRFSLYMLLAAAFHKSAIIVLPLVALANAQSRVATAALLFATGWLTYYLFVAQSLDVMMQNYVGTKYSSQGAAIRIAMNIPPALLFLLFQKRFAVPEQLRKVWRNFAWASFAALIALVLTPSSTAVDRVSLYLIPLQMFVWSRAPDAFRNKQRTNGQIIVAVIAYSAAIQFVWLNFAVHSKAWVPYRFYPLSSPYEILS